MILITRTSKQGPPNFWKPSKNQLLPEKLRGAWPGEQLGPTQLEPRNCSDSAWGGKEQTWICGDAGAAEVAFASSSFPVLFGSAEPSCKMVSSLCRRDFLGAASMGSDML